METTSMSLLFLGPAVWISPGICIIQYIHKCSHQRDHKISRLYVGYLSKDEG